MVITECPICAAEIEFDRQPRLRQRMDCPVCGTKLEVTLVTPEIELDLWEWDEEIPWNTKRTRRSQGSHKRKKQLFDLEDEEDELENRPHRKPKKRSKPNRRKRQHPLEEDD